DIELQFYRARDLTRTCGGERLNFRVRLAAVPAAYIRNDYAHAIQWQVEDFGQVVTHHEGMLRGRIDRELAIGVVIGDADIRFHRVGVDHRKVKFAFDNV